MPTFYYKARNKKGALEKGSLNAPNKKTATEILQKRELILLNLDLKNPLSLLEQVFSFFERIPKKSIVVFSRQLATMVDASLPLVKALRVLLNQTEDQKFRNVIFKLSAEVEGGTDFSLALSQFPNVFSDFYISIIRSGESSGRLPEALEYLADYLERDQDLKSKIRASLTYPAFLLGGLVVVGTVVMIFVIPRLNEVFKDTTEKLPLTTVLIIGLGTYLLHYWWLNLFIASTFGIIIYSYLKTEEGKLRYDEIRIKIPIIRTVYKKIIMARFAQTLSTLLKGSIPIVRALTVVADVLNNRVYSKIILESAQKIEDGSTFGDSLKGYDEISPMIIQVAEVGEKTGKLDEVLEKLAKYYTKEVDNSIANLVEFIQPVILSIIGIAVGLLFASIIIPIYNLASSI